MSDAQVTGEGFLPPTSSNVFSAIAVVDLPGGTPVYVPSSGHVDASQAGGRLSDTIGLTIEDGFAGQAVLVSTGGLVVLPIDSWNDLITGATVGLVPGSKYYVMDDGELAGRLTLTNPGPPGTWVGTALTQTDLLLALQPVAAGALSGDGAMFYGVTAGTGSAGTDYAATVGAGTPVHFPKDGPATGTDVIRSAIATAPTGGGFTVEATGIYDVSWSVAFLEAGQLQLAILTAGPTYTPIVNTTTLSGAGTQENTNRVLVALTEGQSIALISPAGNTPALTVQTADGATTHCQAPNITILRVA